MVNKPWVWGRIRRRRDRYDSIMARLLPHRHDMVKQLEQSLRRRCGVGERAAILAAVSGGADSTALLRGLALLNQRRPWKLRLVVGHVQHHLRPQAEDDARFVQSLAAALGLPFIRADLDLSGVQGNLEAAARRQRYHALHAMARTVGAAFIATAHQGDDQVETLLMRLLRGSSVRGLRGIAWKRKLHVETDGPAIEPAAIASDEPVALVRPMLGISRELIMQFLGDLKQDWCEDHTNQDATRLRARLRRDVLPRLRELRPDLVQRTLALSDHLRQVSRVLADAIDAAADHVVVEGAMRSLDRNDARLMRPAVLAGLLRRLLMELGVGGDVTSQRHLEPVIRAIRDQTGGQRRFRFAGGVSVVVTRRSVEVAGGE
jgi:tRNA(Ile)-lysidine synthetase-like protein